jgi:uncharacterized membrane protein
MTDTSSINALGVFLRGVAMGAADVVPGVSGGTIALITGIYDRLLASISSVDAKALTLLYPDVGGTFGSISMVGFYCCFFSVLVAPSYYSPILFIGSWKPTHCRCGPFSLG